MSPNPNEDDSKTSMPVTEPNTQSSTDTEQLFPVSPARFGIWVFISTEIMFFAALLAGYLVIRLSTVGFSWPSPPSMHVSLATGVLNTIILVLSSVTAWNASNAALSGRPASAKLWLLATLVLGTIFLMVKGNEYQKKYKIGLLPTPHRKQIYQRADYHYLSAVDARMKQHINRLETENQQSSPSAERDRELEFAYEIQKFLTGWTVEHVGKFDNSYHEQVAIRLLANLIYPQLDTARGIDAFVEQEGEELSRAHKYKSARRTLAEARNQLVGDQAKAIEQEIDEIKILNPLATGSDAELIKEKIAWLAVKKDQAETLAEEIDSLSADLEVIDGRVNCLLRLTDMPEGLNSQSDLRLPVVITNGHQWLSLYFLITGCHAVHILAGLIAFLWFVTRNLSEANGQKLYITGVYWHFVDFVWMVIFLVLYF